MSHKRSELSIAGRREAFTLIELLAVIAIVGILSAILIPVVSSVRSSARTAACAGNLRQIALAVIAYSGDHRGVLPGGRDSNGNYTRIYRGIIPPGVTGDGKSTDVIVSKEEGNSQLSGVIANYLDEGKAASIWRCPGNQTGYEASGTGVTYICNNQSDTEPAYFFGYSGSTPGRLNTRLGANSDYEAEGPASVWMISDVDSINYGGQSGYPSAGSSDAISPPHSGGRNYVFFDAHVERRTLDNLPVNP